jgi:enamine deaminase RidA (YjgF/YER057c/UK114 family)
MSFDARLTELGLILPKAPRPAGMYATAVRSGNLVFVSGHGPLRPDGGYVTGVVGAGLDLDAGREAARLTALAVLATLRDHLGSLDRVVRVVKILGMVNATPDVTQHPKVIDGFSAVMIDIFGDAGRAARSAVGMASLPNAIAVEVEAVFEVS